MIRRIPLLLGASLALALLPAAAPAAPDRVALVIGNGAYVNAASLANPTNDAADMARALRGTAITVWLLPPAQ